MQETKKQGMSSEDKDLLEITKKAFNITSLGALATLLGRSKSTAQNWYKNGLPSSVKYEILEMLGSVGNADNPISQKSSLMAVGNNVVQIKGDGNHINHSHTLPPIDDELQEIIELLRAYATPKLKMELKAKLLKYKEFEEKTK
ncbi:hypothetical protein BKH46_09090 [Helicobacter sp. 12S02634-8]|uniref:hypothetical protein n=1 Tax=Helicobacter sp. 12S02634-8 TaxID=1476199 RepID=UPI000BA50011|nr:hypothetical protein [Helicobacter sp. 12S02634-8]PAF46099.1 hypothetical protein BKH46_09090 [Helicobacter sp. 12S02634-8]